MRFFYKIGITNNSVLSRFKKETDKQIIVLQETLYDTGLEALNKEQEILHKYKDFRLKNRKF